ncbi:MAG: hypothetical protein RIR48_525 [Bacteroidota bacterium]|jgi:hypothetical protein
MNIIQLKDIEVTRIQGGMMEYGETGIYPDYLYFHSGFYKKSWKHTCTNDKQTGSLEMDGRTVFEYRLSETGCKIRAVMDDSTYSVWFDVMVILMMKD